MVAPTESIPTVSIMPVDAKPAKSIGSKAAISLDELGTLKPLVPVPPPRKVDSIPTMSTPSTSVDTDTKKDDDWQDLGVEIEESATKGHGGRPSRASYERIDKLVAQINDEV